MQHSISLKKRLLTLLIAAGFLLGSVFAAGSETSAATSRLKVSPTKKTIYVGKATTLKANKKVRWSVYKGKKYVKIVSNRMGAPPLGGAFNTPRRQTSPPTGRKEAPFRTGGSAAQGCRRKAPPSLPAGPLPGKIRLRGRLRWRPFQNPPAGRR